MRAAALIVLWGVLLWGALLTLRAVVTARTMDRRRRAVRPPQDDTAPHVVLLVPALREQELLEEVLLGVLDLDYPRHLLHVVVITTEREERDRERAERRLPALATALASSGGSQAASQLTGLVPAGSAAEVASQVHAAEDPLVALREAVTALPTTREVAQRLLPRLATRYPGVNLHHFHYRGEGAKSSQMVYAVEQLPATLPPDAARERTYVGVYDADSQPDRTTLWHLAQAAGHAPDLIQQLPLQLRRPHAARSTGVQDALLRAHALADLRRRVGIESHRIQATGRITAWGAPAWLAAVAQPVVYGVGAGLFVRHDTLLAIGMYEEPVDDLLVGYKLSANRAAMVALPVFNLVDRYPSVGSLARAYVLGAQGSVMGLRRMLTDPLLRSNRLRSSVMFVKELLDTVWWFAGPPVVAAAATVCALSGAGGALALWAACAGSYLAAHALWCRRRARVWLAAHQGPQVRSEPPRGMAGPAAAFAFLAQPVLHWLGPALYLSRVLTGRTKVAGKTER